MYRLGGCFSVGLARLKGAGQAMIMMHSLAWHASDTYLHVLS
jgi:hypothetical protein